MGYRAYGWPTIMPYMEEMAFIDEGYLLEANRQFFHPLGLILSAQVLDDGLRLRCMDRRELQAGVVYEPNSDGRACLRHAKIARVGSLWEARAQIRLARYGWVVQPPEALWSGPLGSDSGERTRGA